MAFLPCLLKMIILVQVLLDGVMSGVFGLSQGYYYGSCPMAEVIVKNKVNAALREDPTLSAGLLRMHFHDCFVEGCDASILIDSTEKNTAEKSSPANLSLRGFEVIDKAKDEIERQCEGVVSCADIVAMAARDAVFWAGGPYYGIPLGRKDGRISRIQDTINLPSPLLNSTGLIAAFQKHGLSVEDMVALSGGHTLGAASCATFKNRLQKFDSTHDIDPSLDSNFATTLIQTCTAKDKAVQPFDFTRTSFDNAYFRALQSGAGVLTSDQTLFTSADTRFIVGDYARNQAMFYFDFTRAMVRMGMVGVKEGRSGEVRLNCRKTN